MEEQNKQNLENQEIEAKDDIKNEEVTPKKKLPKLPIIIGAAVAIVATALILFFALRHSHTWSEWKVEKSSSCTKPGSEIRTCDECGETETRSISAKGHTDGEWITDTHPTCTTRGKKHLACAVCYDTIETKTIDATGHTDGEWITDIQPTCTTSGSKHLVCAVCDDTIETKTIEKSAHTPVVDQAIPATCQDTGLTEGSHCQICQLVLVEQETTPLTSHNIEHGMCTGCNMIDDAYFALAYYVLCNGSPSSDYEEYYIGNQYTNDGNVYYFFIYTDSAATTLSFRMLAYSESSEVFISMDVIYGSNIQELSMIYNSSQYATGKIYANTFSSSNEYVFDFEYQGSYPSLANSFKNLFKAETALLLSGISTQILNKIDIGITMPMLGFDNY